MRIGGQDARAAGN